MTGETAELDLTLQRAHNRRKTRCAAPGPPPDPGDRGPPRTTQKHRTRGAADQASKHKTPTRPTRTPTGPQKNNTPREAGDNRNETRIETRTTKPKRAEGWPLAAHRNKARTEGWPLAAPRPPEATATTPERPHPKRTTHPLDTATNTRLTLKTRREQRPMVTATGPGREFFLQGGGWEVKANNEKNDNSALAVKAECRNRESARNNDSSHMYGFRTEPGLEAMISAFHRL